jgi:lipopolysaccharide transport system ATP-binding protein
MAVAIKIENLSKQYRLGLVSTRTLSHDLNRWWQINIRGKEDPYLMIGETNDRATKGESEYVWALKDINLEVDEGEVLGIIGKNGAGKSTLLKILSKVTAPTTGIVKARGRIASLLEVGTGFHQEMTGRENIYLNGSIMGMTKSEITRKFDEIVDFAGVERYIDTPVKRYSSGMMVRLGFAIAAHLEPEILVVDEVLAVGDAEFQKKAIGKLQDVSKGEGRTVLFVSHNMAAIQNLCSSAILLELGEIGYPKGNVDAIIRYYLSQVKRASLIKLVDRLDREGEGNIKVCNFEITNNKDEQINNIISGNAVKFKIYYSVRGKSVKPINVRVAISVTRSDGFFISLFDTEIIGQNFQYLDKGDGVFVCLINHCPFSEGLYFLNIAVRQNEIIEDWIQEAYSFEVIHGDFFNTGKTVPNGYNGVLINHNWELLYV